jgi:hypothetical protein
VRTSPGDLSGGRRQRSGTHVISVILYGRNDAHGYNLHRRAALSLNCLAEGLTDPDDEIIFVDYNTPDELPTFIEAIGDTLTTRCLDLLRVLRIPAAVHHERFSSQTHLVALEPVARNAGVRRANPSNRWLLSTNTDMILLPLVEGSLSDICGKLQDGFYGLPRFELPEWLWERLPRSDPRTALDEINRVGPVLGLDEATVSHEWIRFDAPGDFQLVLRDDFLAVDGFNEEMLLGYHVDANLSRRLLLRRGSIESLDGQIAGYHCNHNRVPTIYHGARLVTNDLYRFFFSVKNPGLPEQRPTWGLADTELEEVPVRERVGLEIGERVSAAAAGATHNRVGSDAMALFDLTYDSAHVLPFIADSLVVSAADTTVGYLGANPVLQTLLAKLTSSLGMKDVLVVDLDDAGSVEEVHSRADVVVVDLGFDSSLAEVSGAEPPASTQIDLANTVEKVLAALKRLIQLERARLKRREHAHRLLLVNSAAAFWDSYILANLECSHTSPHSRVRRATVRPARDRAFGALVLRELMRRQLNWSVRRRTSTSRLHIPPNHRIKLSDVDDFAGFGNGWAYPDIVGVWTHGRRAELGISLAGGEANPVLRIGIDGVCFEPGGSISVEVLVDDQSVVVRDFSDEQRSAAPSLRRPLSPRLIHTVKAVVPDVVTRRLYPLYWRMVTPATFSSGVSHLKEVELRIELPADVVTRRNAQITFVIEKSAPVDSKAAGRFAESELGIHLRSLTLEKLDRHGSRSNLFRRLAVGQRTATAD